MTSVETAGVMGHQSAESQRHYMSGRRGKHGKRPARPVHSVDVATPVRAGRAPEKQLAKLMAAKAAMLDATNRTPTGAQLGKPPPSAR